MFCAKVESPVRSPQSLEGRRSRGFAPDPTRRLCLLDLRQGQWPLDPLVALMRGVADCDLSRSVSATPLINAINRFQRASPFGGGSRGAELPWRVRGQSPRAPASPNDNLGPV